jgi:MOSC domain-containing protein YiiM
MSTTGKLLGIATRAAPRKNMVEHAAARITTGRGVGDDFRGKPGRRQVTVLAHADWRAALDELGETKLAWTTRRANLYVDGIDLARKVGYDLRLGDAILNITGETTPCKRMDEARPGLRRALGKDWRGGVTCRVIRSGDIAVGAEVVLERTLTRLVSCVVRERGRVALRRGMGLARRARRLAESVAERMMELVLRRDAQP